MDHVLNELVLIFAKDPSHYPPKKKTVAPSFNGTTGQISKTLQFRQ